jgi:two-component system, sensor histidine kinase
VKSESEDQGKSLDLAAKVRGEQVRLGLAQVRRIPLPHFFVDVCVAATGAAAGLGAWAWVWLATMTVCQVGRTIYLVQLSRLRGFSVEHMLNHMTASLTFLGAIHAVFMGMVFAQPPSSAQYILTMILVGNAAGAVSPAAGHLRSYLTWGVVFGGTLAGCWLSRADLEGVAIAALVVSLFAVLTLYVRDQGRSLVQLVSLSESLRWERDRAERASEAKTRFFAAASHDLRQPLTALSYNAATVQALAQARGDEQLAQLGAGIGRALAESRQLLDSLLEVSQLDAGAVAANMEDVDLNDLVRETVDAFAAQAAERELTLQTMTTAGQTYLVKTDQMLLRRILQNLVGNALKFTRQGSVTVEVRPDEQSPAERLRISVVDTGPGIAPQDHEKVFEEFFQIGNLDRNRSLGLGLGLPIVRRLANLIGAQVMLESEIGQGTRFSIRLDRKPVPAIVWPEPVAITTPTAGSMRRGQGSRRLMLVDDEADIRDSLSTLLQTTGWVVAAGPDQAWATQTYSQDFRPDALIVDFRLRQGESGLDVLAALRQLGCTVPAWLITGDTEPSRIAEAKRAGIPVLYKPLDGMRLLAMLDAQVPAPGG